MHQHVGQPLLNDPVHRPTHGGRGLLGNLDGEVDLGTGRPRPGHQGGHVIPAGLRGQRGTVVVHDIQQRPQLRLCLPGRHPHRGGLLLHELGSDVGVHLKRTGLHRDERQLVADDVVHLPRQAPALLGHRLGRPQLALLLGPPRPVLQGGDQRPPLGDEGAEQRRQPHEQRDVGHELQRPLERTGHRITLEREAGAHRRGVDLHPERQHDRCRRHRGDQGRPAVGAAQREGEHRGRQHRVGRGREQHQRHHRQRERPLVADEHAPDHGGQQHDHEHPLPQLGLRLEDRRDARPDRQHEVEPGPAAQPAAPPRPTGHRLHCRAAAHGPQPTEAPRPTPHARVSTARRAPATLVVDGSGPRHEEHR